MRECLDAKLEDNISFHVHSDSRVPNGPSVVLYLPRARRGLPYESEPNLSNGI